MSLGINNNTEWCEKEKKRYQAAFLKSCFTRYSFYKMCALRGDDLGKYQRIKAPL